MGETVELCRVLAETTYGDLPAQVVHAARRSVLDWLGVALVGSRHPTVELLVSTLTEVGGRPQATVLGRQQRLGILEAPLANGQMGHILDYDDTHMGGVILHSSSPIMAALLALSERRTTSGRDLLTAYVVGFDAGVRVGQSAPHHHRGGWHQTGTLGTFSATVAAGRLLGLDPRRLTHAMGIAGTQAAGMQQNRGTMCKSFHAAKAAANGVLGALLAERGFDSSLEIVEGKRGFARIYSDLAAPERLVDGLGERWEILRNGHKPYACGVVLHPAIDAAIELRGAGSVDPDAIDRIEVRVHPIVLQATGIPEPATGLQSKFSVYHAVSVGILDGAARVPQFTDARALSADVVALRSRVHAVADESLGTDQAEVAVIVGGRRRAVFVEHATGTVDNPMSDADIEAKFMANAAPVLGAERADRVRSLVWKLDSLENVGELIDSCA